LKLKASKLNAERLHETKAKLVFENDQNEPETHELTVIFRGRSVGQNRKFAELIGEDGKYQFVDYLAHYVKEIPELIDEDDQPVAISREMFDTWSVENVTALHDAIEEVINPQKPSSEDTPAG
jgi:hypothetical protein